MSYLFVHFKEKRTPDGEQVYFSLSKDGFHWEKVNGGEPVITATIGERGVRDHTIVRCKEKNKFYIIATDLCLANCMHAKYHDSWAEVTTNGSQNLSLWESEDLVNWSEQKLIQPGDQHNGCMWAPDVIYDTKREAYLLHWSSPFGDPTTQNMQIYGSMTKDFETFSSQQVIYGVPDGRVIDSAIYEEDGMYYLFVKSERNPARVRLLRSKDVLGPYEVIPKFDERMLAIEEGVYEAATAVKLENGKWCLFLDYFGRPGVEQGYVPFISDNLASGDFVRADAEFSFPYGFKHGTILKITEEEYDRIAEHYGKGD